MNADPDWNLYRTFLAVVEEGSLSGAARRLDLTQPTIARQIDTLELAIGADLFVRSQRGLSPTEIALDLRPYAETLAATAAALVRKASGAAGDISGAVRISASEVVGVEHLPPILTRLRQQYPELIVELVVSNRADDLLQRGADVAVRNFEPTQGVLVARRLAPIALGLHARRDYLERRGTPQSLADLAGHDLIGFDRATPAIRAIVQHYPAFGRDAYAFRADSDLARLAAIRAGYGIGICQAPRPGRDADLVRVLAREVDIPLAMWVVMHEDLRTSARCRAVFDALVENLGVPTEDQSGPVRTQIQNAVVTPPDGAPWR